MIRTMNREVPQEFLDGIEGIEVTGKTVPHPARQDVYTLGECVPHSFADEEGPAIRSHVLLHYGSFAALARITEGFDWRHEAWETLTHELRHHLEWRARVPALEALDDAVEANYARHDGDTFDPLFYLSGEVVAEGIFKVEDDIFYDQGTKGTKGTKGTVSWHGRDFIVPVPDELPDFLFLNLLQLLPEPVGQVVLVIRRPPGLSSLWRSPSVERANATVMF